MAHKALLIPAEWRGVGVGGAHPLQLGFPPLRLVTWDEIANGFLFVLIAINKMVIIFNVNHLAVPMFSRSADKYVLNACYMSDTVLDGS